MHPQAITLINISVAAQEQRDSWSSCAARTQWLPTSTFRSTPEGRCCNWPASRAAHHVLPPHARAMVPELERFGYSAKDPIGTGRCDHHTHRPLRPGHRVAATSVGAAERVDCAPFGGFQCRVLCTDDTEASCTRLYATGLRGQISAGAHCTPRAPPRLCPLAQLASA